MATEKFKYKGPLSSVSYRIGTGKGAQIQDVSLLTGVTYMLPGDHPHVQRLVAQGRLVPVKEPKQEPKPPKVDKKENV